MSEVIFVGTSDAFGAGGRRQSAALLRTGSGSVLMDCGVTTNTGLADLGIDRDEIDVVLVSPLSRRPLRRHPPVPPGRHLRGQAQAPPRNRRSAGNRGPRSRPFIGDGSRTRGSRNDLPLLHSTR